MEIFSKLLVVTLIFKSLKEFSVKIVSFKAIVAAVIGFDPDGGIGLVGATS